jgi:predicted transcriptional regulator
MSGPEANERAAEDEDILSFNGKGTPVERKNRFLTPREIITAAGETPPWICEPWVARGGVTDVAGAAKLAGKTTLTACMVKAILEGGYFMGRKTLKTSVVMLTEQGANIVKAFRDAGITEDTEGLYIMPRRLTLDMKWAAIAEAAVQKCLQTGARLLIVDTLPRFAGLEGDRENNAGDVMQAMTPLVDAAQVHGLGVWFVRHANHQGRGRGSTAFLHDVDIVITLRLPDATLPANVRVVEAHGRYDGIPARTNIEYKGGRYVDLGADSKVQSKRAREAALDALAGGSETPNAELMDRISKAAGTSNATANTVIGDLVDEGKIERLGRGVKGNPYRYIRSFNREGVRDKRKKETDATPPESGYPLPSADGAERMQRLIDEGMKLERARAEVLGEEAAL